ncbi:MAG: nucleotidyltransferase domain-containing protein [Pontiella sp.]
MGNLGLVENDVQVLIEMLKRFPHVEQAIVFGSRAKGTFKTGSDVDLALRGELLSFEEASRIAYLLNEETSMPYTFDVLQYETIKSPELVEHIDRVGVVVFQKHASECSKVLNWRENE